MNEKWNIIDIAPTYSISNLGRVMNNKTKRILKPKSVRGYQYVCLRKNNKNICKQVHRLVANSFIPNPLNKECVNHKDFNRSNNCMDNLEWCSKSENQLWSRERISKSAKNKVITDEMRKSYSKCQIAKSKNKYPTYIYKDISGFRFKLRIKGKVLVDKHFKTLEQAIAFKNIYVAKMNEKGELELL